MLCCMCFFAIRGFSSCLENLKGGEDGVYKIPSLHETSFFYCCLPIRYLQHRVLSCRHNGALSLFRSFPFGDGTALPACV